MSNDMSVLTTGSRRRSLLPDVALLLFLMIVLLPVVGWRGVFSSDEGAGIAQASALSEHRSFSLPHPFPAADPSGVSFPLEQSVRTAEGFVPLPKKFSYSLLLAGFDRVAGVPGMIALSIAGTVVAAWMAALLARRIDPALEHVTFWLTGVASPLLIDGYLIIGHTIAAALATGAVVIASRVTDRANTRLLLLGAFLMASAILLRSEALLFGIALTMALGVLYWRRRERPVALAGAAILIGLAAGWLTDRAITARVLGSSSTPNPSAGANGAGSFVIERAQAFANTWLRPGYGPVSVPSVMLISILVLGLIVVFAARRPAPDARLIRLMAGAATAVALALAASYVVPEPQIVPGLVLVFPAGCWGLLGLRRATLLSTTAQLLLVTTGLFAAAVLATQYAQGGGWEWGGRYFALGLPCVTPLVAAGLRDIGKRLDRETRNICIAAVVVSSLALGAMGVGSVRYFRSGWSSLSDTVAAIAATTSAGDGGKAVVVTTEVEMPRGAWAHLDEARWLLVTPKALPSMLDRLEDLHIKTLVIVTKRASVLPMIEASGYEVNGSHAPPREGDWWVRTLATRRSPSAP